MARLFTKIPTKTRREVFKRAANLCEYCFGSEDFALYSHEVDHIIPRKYGGGNELENLALACPVCHENKGSDIGSYDFEFDGQFAPFFNPRRQVWTEHF